MDDRSINLINQVKRTRRLAHGLILLALALPILFVLRDGAPLYGAVEFTGKLVAVTLLGLIARQWVARHYSPGVQVQLLLAFALVLVGWSGYVSRIAFEERVLAKTRTLPADSPMAARIPAQDTPIAPKSALAE
ncbi:MAG: hypothetical protein KGZ83_19710 [Sulfuricella sp.]|nr:hypothetical protein [Sulfuricella sp.]